METLFELTFQDQTLNPQVGTFTDASQTTGTFTQEDGEYYLTNGDTKGFYAYSPVAMQSGLVDDSRVIIEFDLKVVTASANTHTIIGTYTGVDGSGIPTGAKITLQYNAGDIELVLGGGATATLIESADVVVDQWYHFRIDCYLAAPLASTYQVKIDGVSVTTVTGAAADYALGVISVLGTDLHACDECGIKNITLVTETNMYVGRTALDQALQDVKGYVDSRVGTCVPLAGSNAISGSLIPSTDGTVNLGGSSYQWNNAYIKSLTINGVACGDILTHNASEFVPCSGGAVITGIAFSKNVDNSEFRINGGSEWNKGGSVIVYGKDRTDENGRVALHAADGSNETFFSFFPDGYAAFGPNFSFNTNVTFQIGNSGGTYFQLRYDGMMLSNSNTIYPANNLVMDLGSSTNAWNNIYLSNAPIIVSDARAKTQTQDVDDKLLDAWGNVEIKTYKLVSAVAKKGEKARFHTGYLAQDIQAECEKQGVNASDYGLFCYDEWEEREEESEEIETEKDGKIVKEKRVIQPKREKGNSYALRYEEALVVECKYLRRCIARLTARIEELEKGKEQEASK